MTVSIGSSGSSMGPAGALENLGGNSDGKPFDRRVLLRLLAFLKPYWRRLVLALVATLAASGLSLLAPYLIKVAIDTNISAGDLPGLLRTATLLLLTFIGLFVTSWVQEHHLGWVGQQVLANLREELFEHLQNLHLGYHDTHIVGVTISRLISDVSVINDLLSQGLITLVGDAVVFVGIVIVMLTMSPLLALLTFSVLPLMALATWLFTRRAQAAYRETRSRVAAVIGGLAEDITGMRVIQAFAQEGDVGGTVRPGQCGLPRGHYRSDEPVVRVPAHGRVHQHARNRDRLVVRRPRCRQPGAHAGRGGRVSRVREPFLPTHPGAQPAVHHHAVCDGGRRACARAAGHHAGGPRPGGRRDHAGDPRGYRAEGRHVCVSQRRDRCCTR